MPPPQTPAATLIVPGYLGSGPAHWQSWIESRIPDTRRVRHVDWDAPVLARWAQAVRDEIDAAAGPLWLVAHSFGCLASVVAAADRPDKVAGLMLVAPADPERFTPRGVRTSTSGVTEPGLSGCLPRRLLPMPGLVVASTNDPWVRLSSAAYWADQWGCRLAEIGAAGHINADSGHGPWPLGLRLFESLRRAAGDWPLGRIDGNAQPRGGRHGALARVRQLTRFASGRETGGGAPSEPSGRGG